MCVGFGISKAEHVKEVKGWGADGVIVGSACVKALGEAASKEEVRMRMTRTMPRPWHMPADVDVVLEGALSAVTCWLSCLPDGERAVCRGWQT